MKLAYQDTVFEYLPVRKLDDFWVITAHKPKGKPAGPGDNIAADARLIADLEALEITPFPVTGLSPDETTSPPARHIKFSKLPTASAASSIRTASESRTMESIRESAIGAIKN
jgi:hypothetical protein